MSDDTLTTEPAVKPRRARSVFGAVVLVAAGFVFLFINQGLLPAPEWATGLRFWPLILVFLGLDVLVTQLRHPLGTLLSLAVSLAAVAVFGYLLFGGAQDARLQAFGTQRAAAALREETFAVGAEGVAQAKIILELSNYRAEVSPLPEGASDLIAGTARLYGELRVEPRSDEETVTVRVSETGQPLRWLDPTTWNTGDAGWEIGLNRDVPIDLTLDVGNGSAAASLAALRLSRLQLDGGNGALNVRLPDGNYDIAIDGANGATALSLPSAGRQEVTVDGGNGSIRLGLPEGMEARVEFETGSGRVRVDERFRLISGDDDEGVYETAGYAAAGDRVLIVAETGNGTLSIGAAD